MRRRRDSFGRMTYVPRRVKDARGCRWCGSTGKLYEVEAQSDGGRSGYLRGGPFCSWACAESYHGGLIGR